MRRYLYIIWILILANLIIGCSKDDPVDPTPPTVEPKEYYFSDLRCEFYKIAPEDQWGPTLIQACIICANENLQRMGIEVSIISLSEIPLFIYNAGTYDYQPVTSSPISWGYISGFTSSDESGAVVNFVPQVGEFDFVLTTTQPQGYIPGFEDPVIIHESTPPLHLKMWQEGDDWKAELTTKKN